MDKFIVRQVRVSDVEVVCAQMQPDLWGKDNEMTSYQPEALKKFLEQNGTLLLAYDGDKIAGVALCYYLPHPATTDHSFYVHELDTHPDYRRKGVGEMLMKEAMQLAKECGAKELWVGTETDNVPANALYRKLKAYEIEQAVIYSYKI